MSIDVSQHWASRHGTTQNGAARTAPIQSAAVQGAAMQAGRPAAEANGAGPASGRPVDGEAAFGFADMLDIVNPLHHIPVVGTIYREVTGDEIQPVSRILGGTLFGGPLGAAGGIMSAMVEETTGRDPAEHLYVALTGTGDVQAGSGPLPANPAPGAPTTGEPQRHWAALPGDGRGAVGGSADADTTAIVAEAGAGIPAAGGAEAAVVAPAMRHWADRSAAQADGPAGARAQLAEAAAPAASPAASNETLTFFSMGRGDPRTVTIDRSTVQQAASRRDVAGDGATARTPAGQGAAMAQTGRTGQIGSGTGDADRGDTGPLSAMPRIDSSTDAVLRALALASADPARESAPATGGTDTDGTSGQGRSEPAVPPSSPASRPAPAGMGSDDLASSMLQALDRYDTLRSSPQA